MGDAKTVRLEVLSCAVRCDSIYPQSDGCNFHVSAFRYGVLYFYEVLYEVVEVQPGEVWLVSYDTHTDDTKILQCF